MQQNGQKGSHKHLLRMTEEPREKATVHSAAKTRHSPLLPAAAGSHNNGWIFKNLLSGNVKQSIGMTLLLM